jgi:hypothetical protein
LTYFYLSMNVPIEIRCCKRRRPSGGYSSAADGSPRRPGCRITEVPAGDSPGRTLPPLGLWIVPDRAAAEGRWRALASGGVASWKR